MKKFFTASKPLLPCFSGILAKGDKAPQNFSWMEANFSTNIARIIYVYRPADIRISPNGYTYIAKRIYVYNFGDIKALIFRGTFPLFFHLPEKLFYSNLLCI